MVLKQLTIQNFLSIKSITLNLENRGLVLLKGKNLDNDALNNNGAGKSSIIEALVYALYARTLRGLKGDAVVHKIPGKNMKIFLDLTDDDGSEYRIARYRKHYLNKNKSFLFRNGKDITPKSESDFNDYIADLLQADYLTFTSSLLYSAESFKFTSATDSEMKSTFDTMLGLDIYQKCLEITKNRLKLVESEISSTQWKIDDRTAKIEQLQSKLEEATDLRDEYNNSVNDKIKQLQAQLSDLQKQIQSKQEEAEELQKKLAQVKSNKKHYEDLLDEKRKSLKEVDDLKEATQETKDEIQDCEREIRKQNRLISEHNEQIETFSTSIMKLRKKVDELSHRKRDLGKTIGQPCPVCGSPITSESLKSAEHEIEEQIQLQLSEIEKFQAKIEMTNRDILAAQNKISETHSTVEELQKTVEEFEDLIKKSKRFVDEKSNIEKSLQKSQEEYYQVQSDIKVVNSETEQLKDSLKKSHQEIKGLLEDHDPYDSIISKYQTEQKNAQEDIKQFQDSIKTQLDEKTCLEFWQQAYSNQGIKSYILDDITPFLNRRVNKYLAKLSSGHIEVKFNTQTTLKSGEVREKFSIDISNQDGGQEYSANSGGERKRIDLAINLALQDLVASRSNKRMNIAIWDEALDALDEVGIEKVIGLLQELSKEKSTILVVSHNQHLQSYFTNVITVVKENGYSYLSDCKDEETNQD